MIKLLVAAFLIFGASSARANNIVTAEHPPLGSKGYALQLDVRPTYVYSDTFVARDGTERTQYMRQRLMNAIFRVYIPNWMFRISTTYGETEQTGKGRVGYGDTVMEAGASREYGPWRYRILLYAKAPTGRFDRTQPVNIGAAQWDLGPNLYLTRYFFEKRADLNLFAQYLYRYENTQTEITPGKQFSYAVAAAFKPAASVPVRIGVEQRGVLDEPTTVGGSATGQEKKALSIGPVAFIDLKAITPGLQLWPTALFDFYNRNQQRSTQYYLKIQYNY